MKTTKPAVILLAFVLLTAAGAQSDEKPAKKEISNTRTASCLVKVTTNPAVLPLNDEFTIVYLIRSTGVAGKAAREVLEVSPDVIFEVIEIVEVFAGDSALGGYGGGGGGIGIPPGRSPTPTARTSPRPAATPTTSSSRRIATPGRAPTRPPPRRKPTVTQPQSSTTEQTILFHLRVDFSQVDNAEDIKPAAEEFMIALIENLRSALREAFDQYSAKLNNQLLLADTEAIRAEQQLVLMQVELREISGSRDLSRLSILSDIRSVRQKLQSTKMKLASDETIYEATVKRIAQEQARRMKLVGKDPITRELQRIVDIQANSLERIQALVKQKTASSAEVEDVLEKLARARIELAKRQEEVSNPPGSIVLSNLNNELANLATNMALAQQEIRSFEQQLNEAEDLLKNADTYELLSLKAGIAKQSLEETLLWRARLGRNNRSIQPPDVTVIGAE